jgi:hypothetical protein
MSISFPQPETRFTLVVTLLPVYALLTPAPLVFPPPVVRSSLYEKQEKPRQERAQCVADGGQH